MSYSISCQLQKKLVDIDKENHEAKEKYMYELWASLITQFECEMTELNQTHSRELRELQEKIKKECLVKQELMVLHTFKHQYLASNTHLQDVQVDLL